MEKRFTSMQTMKGKKKTKKEVGKKKIIKSILSLQRSSNSFSLRSFYCSSSSNSRKSMARMMNF